MKTILTFLITSIFIINTYAQSDDKKDASKLFFYDHQFGALVKSDTTIAITKNAGMDWLDVNIVTDARLQKILFTSQTNGWLVGDTKLFKTIDGGLTWSENYSEIETFLKEVYMINDSLGFLGGRYGTPDGSEIILKTTDQGENWKTVSIDSLNYSSIIDISFANDSVGISVSGYTIYLTENYGSDWKKLPIDFFVGAYLPSAGEMIDEEKILIVTSIPYIVFEGYLFQSSDGGESWDGFGNKQYFKWGIIDSFILNKDSIWLTTGSETYFTSNGGNYWDTLNVKIDEFSFVSNSEAYGLYDKYILHTNDGWKTHTIIDSTVTSIKKSEKLPHIIKLSQNYPNPFNPSTTIKFTIPVETGHAPSLQTKIVVYDILGREIKTLINKKLSPGSYEVTFDGSDLTSGIYFYVLLTGENRITKKMVLLR